MECVCGAEPNHHEKEIEMIKTVQVLMSGCILLSAASFAQDKKPEGKEALKNPAALKEKAPEKFSVKFETTKGDFTIDVTRASSPNGADRFYNLVKNGYFEGVKFFRVVPNFVVQFGIHGDPSISAPWRDAKISDDPVKASNKRGFLTFAMAGPNTRTTQFFINLKDNVRLDSLGFSPLGEVTKGMEVVDKLFQEYGEQPNQREIQEKGNAYLDKEFPKLDGIKKATLLK